MMYTRFFLRTGLQPSQSRFTEERVFMPRVCITAGGVFVGIAAGKVVDEGLGRSRESKELDWVRQGSCDIDRVCSNEDCREMMVEARKGAARCVRIRNRGRGIVSELCCCSRVATGGTDKCGFYLCGNIQRESSALLLQRVNCSQGIWLLP